jgi:putative endonuclease
MKQPCVYIVASQRNGTLYTGVTSNLSLRVWQHKQRETAGFTKKYNVALLVWYEYFDRMETAIAREKAIKKWNREWKLKMIEAMNPTWQDLYETLNQ